MVLESVSATWYLNQKVLESEVNEVGSRMAAQRKESRRLGCQEAQVPVQEAHGSSHPCDLRLVTWFSLILPFLIYMHEKSITDLPNLWWELNELPVPTSFHRPQPKGGAQKRWLPSQGLPHFHEKTSHSTQQTDFPEQEDLTAGRSICDET